MMLVAFVAVMVVLVQVVMEFRIVGRLLMHVVFVMVTAARALAVMVLLIADW